MGSRGAMNIVIISESLDSSIISALSITSQANYKALSKVTPQGDLSAATARALWLSAGLGRPWPGCLGFHRFSGAWGKLPSDASDRRSTGTLAIAIGHGLKLAPN